MVWKEKGRTYRQLKLIFEICGLMDGLPGHWWSVKEIHAEYEKHIAKPPSTKTIYRYLQIMENVGVVESRLGNGLSPTNEYFQPLRYKWLGYMPPIRID